MVNKFTNQPTNKEVVTKINDVIDAMGTVKKVNNTSPDSNGNVTISIPSISNLANKDLSNLSTTGNTKFQAPLVSGTNIKTVNNQSLLGNGNITVGGGTATDVQINGTTITSNNVANIPLAGTDTLGVAKANAAYGVYNNSGTLTISKATDSQVTAKTSQYRPLVPYNIDLAVKAGITNNSLALTSAEQTAAQNWLDVANIDLSNLSATGQKVIDGQWVYAMNVTISDATGATSTDCTSQLKRIIGDDNYCYDLLIRTWVDYKSATANLSITTEFVNDVVNRATSGGGQRPTLNLIPVGADKSFTVARSAAFNTCSIMLVAYRRIGTNS